MRGGCPVVNFLVEQISALRQAFFLNAFTSRYGSSVVAQFDMTASSLLKQAPKETGTGQEKKFKRSHDQVFCMFPTPFMLHDIIKVSLCSLSDLMLE